MNRLRNRNPQDDRRTSIITILKVIGMAFIFAVIMSIGMIVVFIPASHTFTTFFETFAPPPSVLDWIKIGISVFLPINFILNMFVYLQRRFKACIERF